MRNVFESLDHNSQLYSRAFLNQLVPFISKIASMTDTKANMRVQKAREMLLLDPTYNFVVLDPPEENDKKMWLPPQSTAALEASKAHYYPRKVDDDLFFTFDLKD